MSSKSVITSVNGRVMDGDGNLNKFAVIDKAKLQSYDPDTQTVKLRIDDSNVPGFWMQINVRFDQLEKWVEKMKKMCEENYYDSSDDEDDEDEDEQKEIVIKDGDE